MKIRDAQIVVIDTETTGLSFAKGDRFCELAFHSLEGDRYVFQSLADPGRPIPAGASAVHGITDREVAGKPSWEKVDLLVSSLADHVVFAAHNAEFDRQFVPSAARHRWLCTYHLAEKIWPDSSDFKNGTLRYSLPGGSELDLGEHFAHRAMADVLVTSFVLRQAIALYLERGGVDEIDAFVAYANRIERYPFAKHRGKMISDVPSDDLNYWLYRAREPVTGELRKAFAAEIRRRDGCAA